MVVVIIGREFAVTGLRSIAYARGVAMPASNLGKLKMVSQVVAILLLILGWERMPLLLLLGQAALWVVLATALVSAMDYYRRFNRAVSDSPKVADIAEARAARRTEYAARDERKIM
jgi:CDP-diacylglycerol--glycerol-3-phosphate 3-phosphatidyltransferase